MRWGVEKRLEFIEFRLFWEGGINRSDIMDQFDVSVPQASKDLTLYEEKAPGNLVYDKSAKRYRAAAEFKPVFLQPHADAYLAQLRSESTADGAIEETWLSSTPDFDRLPTPYRRVDVDVLRNVLAAIRNQRALEIHYQSMGASHSAPSWRWITPHALGNDGLRWHVRAFCHIDNKFKDFILSRCLGSRNDDEPGAEPNTDKYWHQFFNVILVPNPALNLAQQSIVAQDYEMAEGTVSIPVRMALLYYFQKRLRLDVADAFDRIQETPVIVSNRAEYESALAEAMS